MATLVRVRRLYRAPLRLGKVKVSNAAAGSLVDLDNAAVRRDLQNAKGLYAFVDDKEHSPVLTSGKQPIETTNLFDASATGTFAATGKEQVVFVELPKDLVVSKLEFACVVGSTTQTAAFATLYTVDSTFTTLTLAAVTNDLGSTSPTANAVQALTFASAYTVPSSGVYAVAICGVAATPFTWVATTLANTATAALLAPGVATVKVAAGATTRTTAAALTVGTSTLATAGLTASASIPYLRLS